jgi:hypothetical protein
LRSREAANAELERAVSDLVGMGIVELKPNSITEDGQHRARRRQN